MSTIEFAILSHVLFPRNLEGVDTELLQYREQIEHDHSYVPTLLANIRALCFAKTILSTHVGCCISLLYIWSLVQIADVTS